LKTEINYPRDKFNTELEHCIQQGESLYEKFKASNIDKNQLDDFQRQLKFWNEEVKYFLKNRILSSETNPYLTDFNKIRLVNVAALVKGLKGVKTDTTRSDYEHLLTCTQRKIDVLILLKNKSKFIPVTKTFSDTPETTNSTIKELFISHSSKDQKYVEQLISIFERIGIPSDNIFCSSFEGYGVTLGDDFLSVIKEKLTSDALVIFILSENFFSSNISLLEMETTTRKEIHHIPIMIPPFDYGDTKGVISTTNGMKINEKFKYNSLREHIQEFFNLKPIDNSIWERKRDHALKEIEKLLTTK
jgi:hypothetical protein